MFGKVVLIGLLSLCSANIFEDAFKKLEPARKGVQRFAMNIHSDIEHEVESNLVASASKDLLKKLRGSVLSKGTPMDFIRGHGTLPLFPLLPATKLGGSTGPRVNLRSWNINNCSQSAAEKATFVVREFDISPHDPVPIPGTLTFKFDINVKEDLDALNVDLTLLYRDIKIPCMGNIGSCSYSVCDLLSNVQDCPDELVKHKINCKCPFNKGEYTEPGFTTAIMAAVFPSGEYKANATLTSNGNFVGCYTADFTIEA